MRERLSKLINESGVSFCNFPVREYDDTAKSELADYLLANGAIVPPCKVGDTVYVINDWKVEKTTVLSMKIESTDSHWITSVKAKIIDHRIKFKEGHWYIFKIFVFGKTAFLTREAAEEALKKEIK